MNTYKYLRSSLLAAMALTAMSANAELIWGITTNSSLISFDSANPAGFTSGPALTGVLAGHTVRGIDFRPSNGQLYAVSNNGSNAGQLYTVNLGTGALTAIGSTFALNSTSTRVSMDFNPVVDAVRIVTGTGQNVRVNADTGALLGTDTNLAWAPGDPTSGTPLISGIAYSNNFVGAGSTTLFAYDFITDNLATIGTAGGAESPNTGQLHTIGNSGVVTGDAGLGFDISGATGIGYISVDDFNGSPGFNAEFFSVNFNTGVLTQIGPDDFAPVLDISVAPQAVPEPATMAALGLGALALIRRKRKN